MDPVHAGSSDLVPAAAAAHAGGASAAAGSHAGASLSSEAYEPYTHHHTHHAVQDVIELSPEPDCPASGGRSTSAGRGNDSASAARGSDREAAASDTAAGSDDALTPAVADAGELDERRRALIEQAADAHVQQELAYAEEGDSAGGPESADSVAPAVTSAEQACSRGAGCVRSVGGGMVGTTASKTLGMCAACAGEAFTASVALEVLQATSDDHVGRARVDALHALSAAMRPQGDASAVDAGAALQQLALVHQRDVTAGGEHTIHDRRLAEYLTPEAAAAFATRNDELHAPGVHLLLYVGERLAGRTDIEDVQHALATPMKQLHAQGVAAMHGHGEAVDDPYAAVADAAFDANRLFVDVSHATAAQLSAALVGRPVLCVLAARFPVSPLWQDREPLIVDVARGAVAHWAYQSRAARAAAAQWFGVGLIANARAPCSESAACVPVLQHAALCSIAFAHPALSRTPRISVRGQLSMYYRGAAPRSDQLGADSTLRLAAIIPHGVLAAVEPDEARHVIRHALVRAVLTPQLIDALAELSLTPPRGAHVPLLAWPGGGDSGYLRQEHTLQPMELLLAAQRVEPVTLVVPMPAGWEPPRFVAALAGLPRAQVLAVVAQLRSDAAVGANQAYSVSVGPRGAVNWNTVMATLLVRGERWASASVPIGVAATAGRTGGVAAFRDDWAWQGMASQPWSRLVAEAMPPPVGATFASTCVGECAAIVEFCVENACVLPVDLFRGHSSLKLCVGRAPRMAMEAEGATAPLPAPGSWALHRRGANTSVAGMEQRQRMNDDISLALERGGAAAAAILLALAGRGNGGATAGLMASAECRDCGQVFHALTQGSDGKIRHPITPKGYTGCALSVKQPESSIDAAAPWWRALAILPGTTAAAVLATRERVSVIVPGMQVAALAGDRAMDALPWELVPDGRRMWLGCPAEYCRDVVHDLAALREHYARQHAPAASIRGVVPGSMPAGVLEAMQAAPNAAELAAALSALLGDAVALVTDTDAGTSAGVQIVRAAAAVTPMTPTERIARELSRVRPGDLWSWRGAAASPLPVLGAGVAAGWRDARVTRTGWLADPEARERGLTPQQCKYFTEVAVRGRLIVQVCGRAVDGHEHVEARNLNGKAIFWCSGCEALAGAAARGEVAPLAAPAVRARGENRGRVARESYPGPQGAVLDVALLVPRIGEMWRQQQAFAFDRVTIQKHIRKAHPDNQLVTGELRLVDGAVAWRQLGRSAVEAEAVGRASLALPALVYLCPVADCPHNVQALLDRVARGAQCFTLGAHEVHDGARSHVMMHVDAETGKLPGVTHFACGRCGMIPITTRQGIARHCRDKRQEAHGKATLAQVRIKVDVAYVYHDATHARVACITTVLPGGDDDKVDAAANAFMRECEERVGALTAGETRADSPEL